MSCRSETCLFLALLVFAVWSESAQTKSWISPAEEADLKRQLKILNKPYVKSIKDNFGNIFDCVDVYKQPAFDHPLLKNHKIQMPNISFVEKRVSKPSTKENPINSGFKDSCPSGTVLIRRTAMEDLARASKHALYFPAKADDSIVIGAYFVMHDLKFYGARAEMDVFNHPNVAINQVSAAQVLVMKGEKGPRNYHNKISFGWRIDHQGTGDNLTHFFISWTSDDYQRTGCLDILCPGFVQLSKVMAPGMILPGHSVIKLNTYREPYNGNWLLVREDNGYELIGYWPKEIFNNMADCSFVAMGGVVETHLNEPSPPMGKGARPGFFRGSAAEFRQVELLRGDGNPVKPSEAIKKGFRYNESLSEYYEAGEGGYIGSGFTFQYGGPGGWKGK